MYRCSLALNVIEPPLGYRAWAYSVLSPMSHILHSPTPEEDASGLRAIRLEPTNVNVLDSVGVEADSEGSVDVDREDLVGIMPSSVDFLGRKDLE